MASYLYYFTAGKVFVSGAISKAELETQYYLLHVCVSVVLTNELI